MRTPLLAANWKMYKTAEDAAAFVRDFLPRVAGLSGIEIALCPPFTALTTVAHEVRGSGIAVGAQDMFWEEAGAYTGEISPGMLVAAGCRYVIIGHSERRQYFGETDETVNRKVLAALRRGLRPIVCVGESLSQREAGTTEEVVKSQVKAALAGVRPEAACEIVIAYEPIWAIGTGRNATGVEANRVIGLIRRQIAELYPANPEVPAQLRIQYGGSVKPENIVEFMSQPEIDGGLVGGASLDPAGFATLCRLSAEAASRRVRERA
ncbi:MAG: triose-phosphate isomerase [Limnochordales bacterium]|nr:triose-phosphate isomerase [Limnochordales bacterium]